MSETKDFHIGDILSITSGILLSPDHIGGVYNILNWMTGDSLFTHQLPRVARECEPFLLAQHPDLAIEIPKISGEEEATAFLTSLYSTLGEFRPVQPLSSNEHTRIDPITEFRMTRSDEPIIVAVKL